MPAEQMNPMPRLCLDLSRSQSNKVSRDLNLFSQAAQQGTPLPNHPAMAPVWASMKTALELITTGQTPADEELERTTERVRTKIRFMME